MELNLFIKINNSFISVLNQYYVCYNIIIFCNFNFYIDGNQLIHIVAETSNTTDL